MRIGRIHQIIAVSLTGVVAGAVAAAPAHAASGGTLSMVGGVVTFTAGNAYNKMSLVVVGDTMTISDSGAPITIAGGLAGTCRALASASVGCEGVHSVSMSLGAGEDTATIVSWRKVTVYAGGGGDVVDARNSTGTMVLWGQGGEDTLKSGDGEDELQGGDAKDHLVAGDGRDWVYGGAGDDDVYGGHGDDHVYGGPDNDHVYGGPDVDFVYGGSGDDFVHGDQGRGFVYGEEGDDQGYGHAEDDLIVLGPGRNQRAYAHGGHDVCRGDDVTVRVGCEES